jgi:hypothetical protein
MIAAEACLNVGVWPDPKQAAEQVDVTLCGVGYEFGDRVKADVSLLKSGDAFREPGPRGNHVSGEYSAHTANFAALGSDSVLLAEFPDELPILQVVQQQRGRDHVGVGPVIPGYEAILPAVLQNLYTELSLGRVTKIRNCRTQYLTKK